METRERAGTDRGGQPLRTLATIEDLYAVPLLGHAVGATTLAPFCSRPRSLWSPPRGGPRVPLMVVLLLPRSGGLRQRERAAAGRPRGAPARRPHARPAPPTRAGRLGLSSPTRARSGLRPRGADNPNAPQYHGRGVVLPAGGGNSPCLAPRADASGREGSSTDRSCEISNRRRCVGSGTPGPSASAKAPSLCAGAFDEGAYGDCRS